MEATYRKLLSKILEGDRLIVRGHKMRRLIGGSMQIDVSRDFPLLTGRYISLHVIQAEANWIMIGDSDLGYLKNKGVRIWDAYGVDDVGPIYPVAMRNYRGFDQLSYVIASIINNPYSRRHIINLWIPDVKLPGKIPPVCYTQLQFLVTDDKLDMIVTYRSTDVAVGLPHDLGVFTVILNKVAYTTALKVRNLIINFGDVHIYEENVDDVMRYLSNKTYPQPKYKYNGEVLLEEYTSVELIKFKMVL